MVVMDNAVEPAAETSGDRLNTGTKKVIVKPVTNAIRILRYLSRSGKPERAAEIARDLSINPSTCFNILRTLVDQDILQFNSSAKTYSIGLGLLKLVESALIDSQRIQAARQVMSELAARFHVTVTLWRRVANRIILVGAEASPTDLSITMSEGQRLPILMGASGRVFAPRIGLGEAELRAEFEQIRWARPFKFEDYWREVQAGLKNGWTVDDGYFSNGIMTVAVPIFDANDNVSFTLSAVMFRGALSEENIPVLAAALREAATKISRVLF